MWMKNVPIFLNFKFWISSFQMVGVGGRLSFERGEADEVYIGTSEFSF
jgi:hypothetical protein